MELVRSWVGVAVMGALALGCGPETACPSGLVLGEGGRCVSAGDGGPSQRDGGMPQPDGGPSEADAGLGPDGCALRPFYGDADGDGHGDPAASAFACEMPVGFVASGDDCDDTCVDCHPGATDVCGDGIDQDCDLMIDEDAVPTSYYPDADGDGHGDASGTPMMTCTPPAGYVASHDDCDDASAMRAPGRTETCDAADDDCDGAADDTFACVRGAATTCTTSCGTMGTGLCTSTCVAPSAAACSPPVETCNGLDEDCDGLADDGLGVLGAPVTGIAAGTSTATSFLGAHLVTTASGYQLFGQSSSGLFTQTVGADGAPRGSVSPLPVALQPLLGQPVSIRAAGSDFVVAYNAITAGSITLGVVNPSGGQRFVSAVAPPSGQDGSRRALIASADGTWATLYASTRTASPPYSYSIYRVRVNISGSAPAIGGWARVVSDLGPATVFDVVETDAADYLAYLDATGALRLAIAPHGAATSPAAAVLGTVVSPGSVAAIAIAAMNPAMPADTANPLGITWQDTAAASSPTTHLASAWGTTAATFEHGIALDLPGGRGRASLSNASVFSRWVGIVAVSSASSGPRGEHWLLVSSDVDDAIRAWEVENQTARTLSVTSPRPTGDGDVEIASTSTGARIAIATDDGMSATADGVVTRQLGCR